MQAVLAEMRVAMGSMPSPQTGPQMELKKHIALAVLVPLDALVGVLATCTALMPPCSGMDSGMTLGYVGRGGPPGGEKPSSRPWVL